MARSARRVPIRSNESARRQELFLLNRAKRFGHAMPKCEPYVNVSLPHRLTTILLETRSPFETRVPMTPPVDARRRRSSARPRASKRRLARLPSEPSGQRADRGPGTFGDALRAIEVLPGVAMPPSGQSPAAHPRFQLSGQPSVLRWRPGADPLSLRQFNSFVNSRLLERVEFYPGNFSTR